MTAAPVHVAEPRNGYETAMHLLSGDHGLTHADLQHWQAAAGAMGPDTPGSMAALHAFVHQLADDLPAGDHATADTARAHHHDPHRPVTPGDRP